MRSRQRRAQRRAAERSERQAALERFGPAADERSQTDRRAVRDPAETERILAQLGQTDRRRLDRRRY